VRESIGDDLEKRHGRARLLGKAQENANAAKPYDEAYRDFEERVSAHPHSAQGDCGDKAYDGDPDKPLSPCLIA
jgi:hypothetical protein